MAAQYLQEGGIVAFPTETVYGLGALATHTRALQRVFAAKNRPHDNPLILHFASVQRILDSLPELPYRLQDLLETTMPGPITWVLKGTIPNVSPLATASLPTIAVRVPHHPIAQALLQKIPSPVAAPSANLSGRPSPTHPDHVLTDMQEKIEGILEAGSTHWGLESTVIDGSEVPPRVLRLGSFPIDDLRKIIPDIVVNTPKNPQDRIIRSPGLKYRHYAPRTPLHLLKGSEKSVHSYMCKYAKIEENNGKRIAFLTHAKLLPMPIRIHDHVYLAYPGDPIRAGRVLYATLRHCDTYPVTRILVQAPPDKPDFATVHDRLTRAAENVLSLDKP